MPGRRDVQECEMRRPVQRFRVQQFSDVLQDWLFRHANGFQELWRLRQRVPLGFELRQW